MKHSKLLIVLLTILIVGAVVFAACDPNTPPTPQPHTCQNPCPKCGHCLDATCNEDACKTKCTCTEILTPAAPSIADKTDFVKFPGEAVTAESFVSLVTSSAETLTYAYKLQQSDASKGTLTDNGNGTFDFTPDGVYTGEVHIVFTVTDNYEQSASKTVTLTYKTVNPVIVDASKQFDMDDVADVVFTVHTYGTENSSLYFDMTDITLNGVSIGQDNYVLKTDGDKEKFSIKGDYLATLEPNATYTFTLRTTAGSTTFTITVNKAAADAPVVDADSKVSLVEKANAADLAISVNLFGKENETVLKLADTELDAESYAITASTITVKAAYLATLSYGVHTFTVVNDNGQATFTVKVDDKPEATAGSDGQNVTKFTHEVIANEALRVSAKGSWTLSTLQLASVKYYDYVESVSGDGANGVVDGLTASGVFGTLTLNQTAMSLGFTRANGWFGVVTFTYKATDELGLESDEITMEVVYKQHAPAIDGQNAKFYNKADGQDIVYTITNAEGNSDFAVNKITNGNTALTLGTDYSVGDKSGSYRYFTIKKEYLATIDGDSVTLTLYTDGGRSDFTITIVCPLSCDNATTSFDMNSTDNVAFTLTGMPLTVQSLKLNDEVIASEHYSLEAGVLTITNAYLKTLPYGQSVLTVSNGYGNLQLTVTVTDTRSPALSSSEVEFTRNSANVKVSVQLYDKTFTELRLSDAVVSADNYTFASGMLTINGAYLDTIQGESATFTVVTSSNELTLTVNFTEVVHNPEVTAPAAGYEIDKYVDLQYSVDLMGNTFAGVKCGETELTDQADYEFDQNSGALTIKASYLNGIYRFGTSSYALTLVTTEGNNADFTVTMDNADSRILNGGFETGSLYGWNSYAIWKNEEGMIAWTNDRVVNGGYFDQNYDYNRDGSYNLGIYGGGISKDSGQERMGHLRSSNFTLGGSGWISFKLGGGRNSSFAYVSVRLTADNTEIARFGNPKFNSETSTGNGEAYLFQYYYDLSEHLNKQMYITITDASSNEWCVLSADSFYTYYATAPATDNGTVAVNILPTILNTDSATNEIKNGGLNSNLDNWDNVNGIFRIDSDFTISNEGGDGATGVLRSSAFTVTDNKYVRFDWAGALKADKQIFVSVKEVGTNIEVLRFVRRDNLSGKENGDFDNHMLDLSSLDGNKQYYLEFADNYNGGWGVSKLKNVRLVNESEWNDVTSGDRAVSISGLNTTFAYQLPYEA